MSSAPARKRDDRQEKRTGEFRFCSSARWKGAAKVQGPEATPARATNESTPASNRKMKQCTGKNVLIFSLLGAGAGLTVSGHRRCGLGLEMAALGLTAAFYPRQTRRSLRGIGKALAEAGKAVAKAGARTGKAISKAAA